VSEYWPLAEINCFLIFSAQRPFRTIFSGLGILGPPFWASENKFSILKKFQPKARYVTNSNKQKGYIRPGSYARQ
jgi:hypothetical protein